MQVDHINNAVLSARAAAEVAAQSGHDLFWFLSPPASFEKQAIPVTDIVQEVTKKLGTMARRCAGSDVQPEDEEVLRVPGHVRARPGELPHAASSRRRASASTRGRTCERRRRSSSDAGHPVGLGMSNEIDSNMLLTSLLYCFGGFIQNEENRIVIGHANSKGTIEALNLMRTSSRAACPTRSSRGPRRRTTRASSPAASRWR